MTHPVMTTAAMVTMTALPTPNFCPLPRQDQDQFPGLAMCRRRQKGRNLSWTQVALHLQPAPSSISLCCALYPTPLL